MKKKLLLFSLATLSLFTLTGCSNAQTKAMTTLKNQIERVENIITNSNTDDISSVSPAPTYNSSRNNSITTHRTNSFYNMTRENQLKEEVLELNNNVKSCLKEKVKLNKSKTNSLKTISSNISKNLSKYNETKNQVKNSVKNIKQNLKVPNINIIEAESDYITLNGNMGERYVYLCNIYDNLEQAYFIICDCADNTYVSEESNKFIENENFQNNSENDNKNKNSRFRKNIDSYAPSTKSPQSKTNEKENESSKTKNYHNIDTFNNYKPPVKNGYNRYNNPYGYGYNAPINNPYNYTNGFNGYTYNYGYGYANGFRRFNPNGNTDTFYPTNRNIDTYRTYPNLNYPVSGTPIENDEEKLETKQNGVINTNESKQKFLDEYSSVNSDMNEKDNDKILSTTEEPINKLEKFFK